MSRNKKRPQLPINKSLLKSLLRIFSKPAVETIAEKVFIRRRKPDLAVLRRGILRAACAYITDINAPTRGEIKRQIKNLMQLAQRGKATTLAAALRDLHPATREFLESRGLRRERLPSIEEMSDPTVRRRIILICTAGSDGSGGPILHAPVTLTHAKKRDAERNFLWLLRFAICEATGWLPGRTANKSVSGPLVRLAEECLALLNVEGVNVVRILEREARRNWRWGGVSLMRNVLRWSNALTCPPKVPSF